MDNLYTIAKFFSNRLLFIPNYQRGYAWEETQWEDFIQDLELLTKNKEHFTGMVVLHPRSKGGDLITDEEGKDYEESNIVDGQQRLTTAVILLDIIRREMLEYEALESVAKGIEKNYIAALGPYPDWKPIPKITLNRDCQNFFYHTILGRETDIVGPQIRSHKLLLGVKEHFNDYLKKKRTEFGIAYPEYLGDLHRKVTQLLTFVIYTVDEEAEVGVIFETMNNRGKGITELEKVKNYLLYLATKLDLPKNSIQKLADEINDTWTHIFERLMAADLGDVAYEDQLLRAHWLMVYDYNRQNWHQSRSIKERFSLKRYQDRHDALHKDIYGYLTSLRNSTTAYCDILNPRHSAAFKALDLDEFLHQKILHAADRLARLGAMAAFLPLLMAVRIQLPGDGHAYLESVELCERFAFRVYRWVGRPSNTGQSRLFRLGYNLYQNEEIWTALEGLRRAVLGYCTDSQFKNRFDRDGEDWYRWTGIKYFLYEYEQHLADQSGQPVRMPWEYLAQARKDDTIEHILPQEPDREGYWEERFNEEQYKKNLHDIGNFTLTYDNSALGNKPFPEKKGRPGQSGCYAGSKLFVEQQIASYEDWTEESIIARRNEIETWALERWHIVTPPPEIKGTSDINAVLVLADQRHVGDELRSLLEAVKKYPISPNLRKYCVQLRPRFNLKLSIFTFYPYENQFGAWIYPGNIAKFPNADPDLVVRLFGEKRWQRFEKHEIVQFIGKLDRFFGMLE